MPGTFLQNFSKFISIHFFPYCAQIYSKRCVQQIRASVASWYIHIRTHTPAGVRRLEQLASPSLAGIYFCIIATNSLFSNYNVLFCLLQHRDVKRMHWQERIVRYLTLSCRWAIVIRVGVFLSCFSGFTFDVYSAHLRWYMYKFIRSLAADFWRLLSSAVVGCEVEFAFVCAGLEPLFICYKTAMQNK